MTLNDFVKAKRRGRIWTLLTAYDAPSAEILEKAGVDMLLVGDSLGMVLLGYPSTALVTMDEMIHHAKAVRRGAKKAFVIGDMPLKGVEKGPKQALESARRFVKEAGCDAVKLEWNKDALKTTDLLVRNGIPVMGHVGLTPQTASQEGGFKVRGKGASEAFEIFKAAKAFEEHGAFSVILECIPEAAAKVITENLKIPAIGIGAGRFCDGQVLVIHDVVGLFNKFTPRFVKRYAELESGMRKAILNYVRDVKSGRFPEKKHTFGMEPEEAALFKKCIGRLSCR